MFVIADVGTSIWLVNYRDTVAMYWMRSVFRSIYGVSIALVLKTIVMDWAIHSLTRYVKRNACLRPRLGDS
jgi:hypothetical protein